MKLVITTTYNNIDEEWLVWYKARMMMGPKELRKVAEDFKKNNKATYESKDPSSDVNGVTTYEVLK